MPKKEFLAALESLDVTLTEVEIFLVLEMMDKKRTDILDLTDFISPIQKEKHAAEVEQIIQDTHFKDLQKILEDLVAFLKKCTASILFLSNQLRQDQHSERVGGWRPL